MNRWTLMKVMIKKRIDGCKFLLARIVTKQDNFVLFQSFDGASYSDNPRFISEKLHEMYPDIKIVWAFKNPATKKDIVPGYVRTIRIDDSIGYYKELASCKVWVNNFSFKYVPKRKGQVFIQTWHGDRGFKKILNDSGHRKKGNLVSESIKGYCDLAVCGSLFGERTYRTAFGYEGTILMEGTPRDDFLLKPDEEKIKEIKAKLNVAQNTKLLLFAPTFRQANQLGKTEQKISSIDISKVLDALEKKYGGEWKGILRAHPAVVGLTGNRFDSRIIDATKYEDMADLLLVSDVLITDYSSCAGDFALLGRLLLLYQPDRKEYESIDRTLYFKLEDSPYYIAESQHELEDIILHSSEEATRENCEQILQFYGTKETGKASEIVAEIIHEKVSN